MGAARYVGRVGGLAVALGVGTAVATGHGLALATPDTGSPPSNPSGDSSAQTTNTDLPLGPNALTGGSPSASTQTTTGSTAPVASPSGSPSGTTTTSSNASTGEPATGDVVSTGGAQKTPQLAAPTWLSELTQATTPQQSQTVTTSESLTPPETPPAAQPQPATSQPKLESATPTSTGKSLTVSVYDSSSSFSRLTLSDALPTMSAVDGLVGQLKLPTADADTDLLSAVSPAALARTSTFGTSSVETLNALAPAPVAPPLSVRGIVTSLLSVFGLGPLAATNAPVSPAQPTLLWGLLAWVRREIGQGVSNLLGMAPKATSPVPTGPADLTQTGSSATTFALAASAPAALAAAANAAPNFPVPGQQLSPSTSFVSWLTGNYPPNNTMDRFGISGTDVGIIWDNGIPDNPNTLVNEHQVLIAFGDTFGNRAVLGEEWRSNTLFRTSDAVLSDGILVPNGVFVGTGPESSNVFGGSPLDRTQWLQFGRTFSKNLLVNPNLGSAVTLIPTSAISVPTPGTPYGAIQYMSFMAVQQWGSPGQWTTSYSAIASSMDNGESWQVAPQTVRYNQWGSGNQNFQQVAFVRPGDGFVYMYGTPNGRQGSAYLSRVPENSVLDLTKYEYWSGGTQGFFFFPGTAAGWYKNNPAAATAIIPPAAGACGAVAAGNTVSEMSVQYNSYLKKYVILYTDQNNSVVMRTSDKPQGTWSDAKVLMPQQPGGIYAPMMHPWSSSTLGTGTDLYWNLSLWSEYNVMLMRTDLTKV